MDEFVKADSRNLPVVDIGMLLEFFAVSDGFSAAEIRGAKVVRSMRSDYTQNAIGYVQIRRKTENDSTSCTLLCEVCPEHRTNSKNYKVNVEIDETEEKILTATCLDCVASEGCCKHVVAFLMWLNEKTLEPSPTDTVSYWKKPALSRISQNQYVTLKNFGKPDTSKIKVQSPETVLQEFLHNFEENQTTSINIVNMAKGKPINGSLHTLVMLFKEIMEDHTYENFLEFLKSNLSLETCEQLCEATVLQADSRLWFELRYGRITASTIFILSRAKNNTTIQKQILGSSKHLITRAIVRGKELEDSVVATLSEMMGIEFKKTGFLISQHNPIIGASPDGISKNYVVEVKCPASEKTIKNYVSEDGRIKNKFKAQIQLQMLLFKKKKGIFVIADPNYEENKKITFIRCKFQPKFINKVIDRALAYWRAEVFPKLLI